MEKLAVGGQLAQTTDGARIVRTLCGTFAHYPKCPLRSLDLQSLGLRDVSLRPLIDLLNTGAVVLSSLNLSKNLLTEREIAPLLKALSLHGSRIRQLNVAMNPISDDGGVELAEILGALEELQALILHGTEMQDAGVAAILEMTARQKHLEYVDLNLHHGAAARAGDALVPLVSQRCENKVLHTLLLRGARLPESAIKACARAVGNNQVLAMLDLHTGAIAHDSLAVHTIDVTLQRNKLLKASLRAHVLERTVARLVESIDRDSNSHVTFAEVPDNGGR